MSPSRKGLSLQTRNPPKSKSVVDRQSVRSQLFSSPSVVFGASTHDQSEHKNLLSSGPQASGSSSPDCLISKLSTQAPPLAVSGGLPSSWGSDIAAFHPALNQSQDMSSVHRASRHSHASDLRIPCGHGHKHQHTFVLGGYDTAGKRCGDIQPRLAREEVVRAEKVMAGIRREEERTLEDWLKRSFRRSGFSDPWTGRRPMKTPCPSLASSSTSSSRSRGPDSDCGSLSFGSSASDSSQTSDSSSRSRCSEQHEPSPIVIDAIFDLDGMHGELLTVEECDEEFAKIDELLYQA